MRRYLALVILLCMFLTACINWCECDEDYGYGGLQAVVAGSNEFGVVILLRNETGKRLYYNDDFRVDYQPMSNHNNRAGVQFINHGDTKDMHVNWASSRPSGIYTFERDFFHDRSLTEFYKTLSLDFDVIGWYHFTDNPQPVPEDLQAHRDARERERLAFQVAGGPSNVIVLAS